jgi:hypothetical protein
VGPAGFGVGAGGGGVGGPGAGVGGAGDGAGEGNILPATHHWERTLFPQFLCVPIGKCREWLVGRVVVVVE